MAAMTRAEVLLKAQAENECVGRVVDSTGPHPSNWFTDDGYEVFRFGIYWNGDPELCCIEYGPKLSWPNGMKRPTVKDTSDYICWNS